jgi:tetratricopeptide (TPR) repeat protein
MKILAGAILALGLAAGTAAQAQTKQPTVVSSAQQKIAQAQAQIDKDPKRYQAYNQLAMALARRARETSDVSFYAKADAALARSFEISPGNIEGQKVQAWILLGKHEFAKAAELAKRLNEKWPDDVLIYGYLVDANVEMGNYPAAEAAAQWMLDIRPGNVPGLTRAAYLRELFGDVDGAIELMEMAYRQTPPNETEDRAWILTQIAHLQFSIGDFKTADQVLRQALALFPDYHYALASLAKVRAAEGNFAEAAGLLQQRYRNAAHAENAYDLAVALERAGRRDEGQALFAEFEAKARKEIESPDNANRELIFYYADHANRPEEALRIAAREFGLRKDVYTLDAYGWALSANGRNDAAREQLQAALAVGVRDAQLFYHAGIIAERAGDVARAAQLLRESLKLNPVSEHAGPARVALDRLPAS